MEPYEKTEMKREIIDEVRKELTRSARKDIQNRILLALCILAVEALFWIATMVLVAKVLDGFFAFIIAMTFCFLRCTQMNLIKEFCND